MRANAFPRWALLSRIHGTIIGFKYKFKRKGRVLDIHHRNRRSFFSLPAELREIIYRIAAQREDDVFLRNFKPPGICRVSRLMRQESLPIFFEVNIFVVEVPAPIVLRQVHHGLIFSTTRALFFRTTDSRFTHTGVPLLDPGRSELLRNPEFKLLLPNIDLIPLNFEIPPGWPRLHLNAVVSLRATRANIQSRTAHYVHGSLVGSAARSSEPRFEADLRHVTIGAASFVRAQAQQNDFRGLSPSESSGLAGTVRVDPRTGPHALLDDLQ